MPKSRRKPKRKTDRSAAPRRVRPTAVVVGSVALAMLGVASYLFLQIRQDTDALALAQITPTPASVGAIVAQSTESPGEPTVVVTLILPTDMPTAAATELAETITSLPTSTTSTSATLAAEKIEPTATGVVQNKVAGVTQEASVTVTQVENAPTSTATPAETALPTNGPEESLGRQAQVTANFNLNMRSGPGTGFDIVDIMLKGESFEVLDRSQSNAWLFGEITSSGQQGWIWADYTVASSTDLEQAVQVKTEAAATPAEIAAITPTPNATAAETAVETEAAATETPAPTSGSPSIMTTPQVIVTSVINVNLRSGPSTAYNPVIILPTGELFAVEALSEGKNWYYGEFVSTGRRGWIWADNTETADPSEIERLPTRVVDATSPTSNPTSTLLPTATGISATSTAVVTSDSIATPTVPAGDTEQSQLFVTSTLFLNVRSGPSTNNDVIGVVRPNEQFEVLAISQLGNWYFGQVVATGELGWIWAEFTQAADLDQIEALPTKVFP